jgi:hypothetical protein
MDGLQTYVSLSVAECVASSPFAVYGALRVTSCPVMMDLLSSAPPTIECLKNETSETGETDFLSD